MKKRSMLWLAVSIIMILAIALVSACSTAPTSKPTTTPTSTSQAPVLLGSAGNFTILAKSGISTTGTTSIVGDIGISPAAATFITGFGLIMDASNQFSTSSLVTGKVYAPGYAVPTPANMTTAVSDMENRVHQRRWTDIARCY